MMETRGLRRQHGLTFVELMIAMVLSLVTMGATLALFSSTKNTFALQQAVSQVQSDGNAALALLKQQIRLAGYPEDSLAVQSGVVGTDGSGGDYAIVDVTPGFSETASDDSSLIIQFEAPRDDFFNCAGEEFDFEDMVAVRIALTEVGGVNGLTCQGTGAPAELVSNVSNLQIQYGEYSSAATSAPVVYKAYSDVGNARNVVAVRLSFDVGSDHPDLQPRSFTTTIPMRNQVH
jgi:type II secretory pathway pseudopilin PulG